MKKSLLIGGIVMAAVVTSCNSVRTVPVTDLSGEWNVEKIDNKAIEITDGSDVPYLAFDVVNSRVFGSLGCNRVSGLLYATDAGVIDLAKLAGTRMMCPDMTVEDNLLAALGKVSEFGIDKEGKLVLMDQSHRSMVTLAKRADSISLSSLEGTWKVNQLGELDLSADTTGVYTIEFAGDGRFMMTTGCNNVGGSYTGRYVDISFSQLMSTRMMCPDMEVETVAQNMLPVIASFGQLAEEGTMGFYDNENNLVMAIARQ